MHVLRGLTQKKQIAILDAFRNDKFPVLVSTSVLEEGLDVDECNLVIFYDGTASAIRKIQRTGRTGRTGRKQKGRVVVLTTHHTADTASHFISNAKERRMNFLLRDVGWLKIELEKEPEVDTRAFAPKREDEEMVIEIIEEEEEEMEIDSENVGEKLASFKGALKDLKKWNKTEETKKPTEEIVEKVVDEPKAKKTKTDKVSTPIKIIVDSREKNSKILFYLKKEGIELDFKQLDNGDYILSDRVAIEYKKGEDLLSSIIDGRLFEQLGSITNAYQIPILLIEGFPSGGIHPEAIAGALSSFMIDFGVSIIQTQSSEETAAILKRIAMREQKTKKRPAMIRKAMRISNPKENLVQVISSFPGINRTLASRMLEDFTSIKGVVNSSAEELKDIEGLGPKKSKKFIDLVNQEYK